MGGEKHRSCFSCRCCVGSPPRGRGKDFSAQHPERGRGITPAWAGKSKEKHNGRMGSKDHPRVGGEKFVRKLLLAKPGGSPPRGRGKDLLMVIVSVGFWITPAWAGKRRWRVPRPGLPWDHPRVGGEKAITKFEQPDAAGSPPRGRGKVRILTTLTPGQGITPAWAGKSGFCGSTWRCHKDHPRVGGEKTLQLLPWNQRLGSPPRGRGKDWVSVHKEVADGITPAWAGKRPSHSSERRRPQDHPRVGGEKLWPVIMFSTVGGSPPRGRGKGRHLSHGLLPCG